MEKNFIFTGIHVNEYLFQSMEQSKYYFYAIGGIISCVRNVCNHEATWLAMKITILEGHNSSFGFILYVDMENRHYEAYHYSIFSGAVHRFASRNTAVLREDSLGTADLSS
jgi:hypothetical protein